MLPSHGHPIMVLCWALRRASGSAGGAEGWDPKSSSSGHVLLETLCVTLSKSESLSILLGVYYQMRMLCFHRGGGGVTTLFIK
jgi:hypothetical protein